MSETPEQAAARLKASFRKGQWNGGSGETISGEGSTLHYTENLRAKLPEILRTHNVKTFLDAPCGDFNWMKEVDLAGIHYIGMDIVEEIIVDLQQKYQRADRTFLAGDITTAPLPKADLMLCRDCLFHLPYEDAWRFFENFVRTGPSLLLLTSNLINTNKDIPRAGTWRQLNLRRPPFNLDAPMREVDDWVEGRPKRIVGLWTKHAIMEALKRRQ